MDGHLLFMRPNGKDYALDRELVDEPRERGAREAELDAVVTLQRLLE